MPHRTLRLLGLSAVLLALLGGCESRRLLRKKAHAARQMPPSNGMTVYMLLQYANNQFCAGPLGACQQVDPAGQWRLVSDSMCVKMESSGSQMKVTPGTGWPNCDCGNAGALAATYNVDELDTYGQFTVPQNGGCKTEGGIGVRLVKGTWCEASSFKQCAPKDDEFTKLVKNGCPNTAYNDDVSGSSMCNYPGFNLKSMTILKHVPKNVTTVPKLEAKPEPEPAVAATSVKDAAKANSATEHCYLCKNGNFAKRGAVPALLGAALAPLALLWH